ncbi:MAG: ABC transporter permease [Hamadaea sp.]|uniref:ABC transporter permease n=1 Tax=Hamadaea sp. NPDC050747 TaxID=3155789 RepID=UPI0017A7F31C|nr:ABC transporter permease [Hamadaea sp.]NUR52183.1 ABC transporter permease [Hamadaea sp.]NUR74539.1 ABC transporter permease [Hamadaea sp.]NUT07919.1 ABC transporter permease [Hamadaea sp.]
MSTAERLREPPGVRSVTGALADGWVVAKRNLIKIKRIPDLLIFSTIQPIMFVLLFAYVFGGSIIIPGISYREYLMPGIFVQTVAFGAGITAIGLADDLQKGIVDRFRSLPMSRAAVLVGRTTSDLINNIFVVVVMSVTGLIVGWRIHTGVLDGIYGFLLLFAFGYAMSWISAVIGLSVKSVEVAQSAGFIWMFPLTFLSNAFVSTATLPGWLQPVAEWNPISSMVLSLRKLWGNVSSDPVYNGSGFPAEHAIPLAIGWIALILIIFVPLAISRYRKAASR